MAFLAAAAASSIRTSLPLTFSSRRRTNLSMVVKASSSSSSSSSRPLLLSLRSVASAAVLLAATSPALASVPSPPPPLTATTTTTTVSDEDSITEDSSADTNTTQSSFEELFEETALLAHRGDAAAALARLDAALATATARDARLIMAQVLFLENKVDEAIAAYEELASEDPGDYRPVFCQGVIYRLLEKNEEANVMFQKCREIAPEKFDVSPAPVLETEDVEANA